MASLLMFCEARADFETAAGLVERVLRDEAPGWVLDLLDGGEPGRGTVLAWVPDGDRTFFDLHDAKALALRLGVRIPHGHFNGEPGKPDAFSARAAFLAARELTFQGISVDAVLWIRDMDDQGDDRRCGFEQARAAVLPVVPFKILVGCPDPVREAWVLAGFDPETDAERSALEAERRALGFCPCQEAHALTAKDEHAKKSPKRVVAVLMAGDPDRESRCWTAAPLATLRARGERSGLAAFLAEVSRTLIPVVTGAPAARP